MRLLQIIVVLFGISFITFGLTYMSPGDPVRNMYSANGVMPTEEMVEQTREEMGLNDSVFCTVWKMAWQLSAGRFRKILFPEQTGNRTSGRETVADLKTDTDGDTADAGTFYFPRYGICFEKRYLD